MNFSLRIAHGYFYAKQYIIKQGFANEIDWQEERNYASLTEHDFIKEAAWVILASGLSDKVVRKKFPLIKSIMFDFESISLLCQNCDDCIEKSLKVFNHQKKIQAIVKVAEHLDKYCFLEFKQKLLNEGIPFLQTFPYIGKATAFHLAKNIGLDVVKPDRHLLRIADTLGFNSPFDLCNEISIQTEERLSLIDLVIWRYATLNKNYLKKIELLNRLTN